MKLYPSAYDFTQALLVMLVTNFTSDYEDKNCVDNVDNDDDDYEEGDLLEEERI